MRLICRLPWGYGDVRIAASPATFRQAERQEHITDNGGFIAVLRLLFRWHQPCPSNRDMAVLPLCRIVGTVVTMICARC